MSVSKQIFSSALLILAVQFGASGQAARTPFSSFGLGQIYGNALTHNQGSGGLGISNPDY